MDRKSRISYADVHTAIFNRLVQGHYRPTRRIGIAELAQVLRVSTTPVREALRQLVGRDLMVERHREGFYLAPLSARAISSLYRAHGDWMIKVLKDAGQRTVPGGQLRSMWRLFDASAVRTEDVAMIAVRRYLDARLAVLRRHEPGVLGDMSDRSAALVQALAREDVAAALTITDAFHQDCAASAERLAAAFDPAG